MGDANGIWHSVRSLLPRGGSIHPRIAALAGVSWQERRGGEHPAADRAAERLQVGRGQVQHHVCSVFAINNLNIFGVDTSSSAVGAGLRSF